jgi:hypothetical protein
MDLNMSRIPLHPKRALDPHLCCCARCGKDTNALTVGHIKKGKSSKGWVYFQAGDRWKTESKLDETLSDVQDLEEGERVPDFSFCDSCRAEITEQKKEVEENGGVYFRCVGCQAEGVIKGTTPFAKHVREVQQRMENAKHRIHDGWWTTASQLKGNDHRYLPLGTEINCKMHEGAL